MKHLLLVLAIAACGSQKPAPATPAEPDHIAHHVDEGSGSAVAATPEMPKEPEKPAETPKDPKVELLAAETAAWETAKPVFEKSCATCHTSAGKKAAKKKLDHFNMDTYPLGGHHTATIGYTIREVLGISGKKPTMPYDKPGSVKGDDLAKIKAWTDAWEAAEKGGAHPPADKDHHD
jgi:mono/diheme cytochrome c family protein